MKFKVLYEVFLINRVQGSSCKLYRPIFFRSNLCAVPKSERKKRGSVTYRTNRENMISKILVLF